MLAVGTVAACVLIAAVLLYPTTKGHPVVGLSAIDWKTGLLEQHSMGQSEPTGPATVPGKPEESLAVVIRFQGFDKIPDQQVIDSLYSQTKPSREVRERFRVLAPEDFRKAVESGKVRTEDRHVLLDTLRTNLGVTEAVIITIYFQRRAFVIESDLIDTATGRVLNNNRLEATEENLSAAVGSASAAVFPAE